MIKGKAMSNHTPGPWVIYPATNGSEICAVDMEPGLPIRAGIARVNQYTYGEWIGNARLIAAAPELLEALEMMLEMSEMGGFGKAAAEDVARVAIAKAKGEEQ